MALFKLLFVIIIIIIILIIIRKISNKNRQKLQIQEKLTAD